jgi:1-pyrroline-5-carboxylate dehydrogenase
LASRRKLSDLTIGPVITWNNTQIKNHISKILGLPNTKIAFGGN